MASRAERRFVFIVLLAFLVLISFPFAAIKASDGHVFGGFLLNPIDGNSYLAKMRQGYEGSWLFTLPYTAEPGPGAAINLYYLFLGHAARTLGVSQIFIFHAARLLGALLLGLALYRFFSTLFIDARSRLFAFAPALFGSGLGWLAFAFGMFTSDFWVAEAFPFLASYANPHFPLGIALQVWLLTPLMQKLLSPRHIATMIATALLLSLVYPFGWALTLILLSLWLVWLAWRRVPLKSEAARWLCVALGGGPYALYQWWIVHNHPVLSQWNAQNLTSAPPLLDLIISLSPALLLAIWGIYLAARSLDSKVHFLVLWLLAGILVLYLPFNLQRRLISGLYIPSAALAAVALQNFTASMPKRRWMLASILLLLSLPTNLLVIAGGLQAAKTQPPAIHLYESELQAFAWLDENAASGALVLAAPDSGLLIPAYCHSRVLYGHPFETVNAINRRELVENFFLGDLSSEEAIELLEREGVDYILFGPREQALGSMPQLPGWQVAFETSDLQIWAPAP